MALLVQDLERALGFYEGLLGLNVDPDRPHHKLPYRGAWLSGPAGPEMIHLMELDGHDRPQVTWRVRRTGRCPGRRRALGSDLDVCNLAVRCAACRAGATAARRSACLTSSPCCTGWRRRGCPSPPHEGTAASPPPCCRTQVRARSGRHLCALQAVRCARVLSHHALPSGAARRRQHGGASGAERHAAAVVRRAHIGQEQQQLFCSPRAGLRVGERGAAHTRLRWRALMLPRWRAGVEQ